jgi:hypothetical protein
VKKIAQNGAQPIFLSKLIQNLYTRKVAKIGATSVIFKKIPKVHKLLPIGRKFAQSGHPGRVSAWANISMCLFQLLPTMQGDQNGRICTQWAIINFGQFNKNLQMQPKMRCYF